MSDLLRELAAFAATDRAAWRATVEKALKGRPYDEALVRRTPEGLAIDPLYTRADRPAGVEGDVPGAAPFTRGFPATGGDGVRRGWLRSVEIAHADAQHANGLLRQDLDGGAQRIVVRATSARAALGRPFGETRQLASAGTGGVWIDDRGDLETLLDGIAWSMAPVAVLAPPGEVAFTRLLFEMCEALRVSGGHGVGAQVDLLGVAWSAPDATAWLQPVLPLVAAEAGRGACDHADARPLLIATTALRQAGADAGQDLAAALGLFVAAARALDGVVPLERLLRVTEFRIGVGTDFFGEIARLRAFRRALGVVLDTLGVADHAADAMVTAATAAETLTRRDVYVNLLRTTAQATAAVVGGADAVIVLPFDTRCGGGTAFSRRLARNLHSLLGEESDVGTVVDPAGGSFYLESRTEQLAAAAWQQFVTWEAAGGFVAACGSGTVAAAVGERREARATRVRSRRDPVLGVSVFAPQADERHDGVPFDADAFIARWQTRLGATDRPASVPTATTTPLPVHYLGDDFEALRDEAARLSQAAGARSTTPGAAAPLIVFGVLVGHPAAYAARLDWLRDLLAVAGFTILERRVNDDAGGAADGFADSGAVAAVVVAPDTLHGTAVPEAASALRAAGATTIVVAGRPGKHETAQRAAGVTGFAYAGADAVSFLTTLLQSARATHAGS